MGPWAQAQCLATTPGGGSIVIDDPPRQRESEIEGEGPLSHAELVGGFRATFIENGFWPMPPPLLKSNKNRIIIFSNSL